MAVFITNSVKNANRKVIIMMVDFKADIIIMHEGSICYLLPGF